VGRTLRAIVTAFAFLTRLPIRLPDDPGAAHDGDAADGGDLARSLPFFPLVGAALGAVLVGADRLLRGHLAPGLTAVALVALLAALTGGLHLDGLGDLFDALGGGRGDRARMLAIMRDSRIGAHGAIALTLALLAKVLATAQLVERDASSSWALFAAPVVARWAVVPLIVHFRYARPEGLGRAFKGHARAIHFAGATALTAALLAWTGPAAVGPTLAALGVALAVAVWLDRRLGGLTGDVYGAAIELAELAWLVAAAAR
jgi:adenosylcobinamide-GDP ribazoletransferase